MFTLNWLLTTSILSLVSYAIETKFAKLTTFDDPTIVPEARSYKPSSNEARHCSAYIAIWPTTMLSVNLGMAA